MNFAHITTVRNKTVDLNICYKDKIISNISYSIFFGIILDSTLTWSNIEFLTKKLSTTCYVIRTIKPCMSESALKMIYLSLFHSILICGIIFWGNSSQSITIFKVQEKVIRVIMGRSNRNLCRNLFEILTILPLKSQNVFSLLIFVVNKKKHFTSNADNYNMPSRQKITCICMRQIWSFFKKELIIRESQFLIVFLLKLRFFQMITRNLKLH
jgi:hypothetical protein